MAIKVKNVFIKEDILDENGNKIGEIKFNPNDSRIMNKLTKIVNDLSYSLKDLKNLGEIKDISKEKLEKIEDFEKVSESFEKITKGYEIELKAVNNVFNDLSEIFGEDTINLFTGGTKDIMSLMPLIEFIIPYIQESRKSKVNKYIKSNTDVMD